MFSFIKFKFISKKKGAETSLKNNIKGVIVQETIRKTKL